jgi:tetratricopeptide (TPR) repeat protein
VAEVGGRLRVSAEVIDPRTQTTVYAVMADGRGVESALSSIDKVTDQLRGKLGEALQSVQKTSVPLPNVATPSLDALKAFAVARNVVATTRDREQALGLYQRALQLDPQFALAYSDMADLYSSLDEVAKATEARRKALAIPQRLSQQEQARVELLLVQHSPPTDYLRQAEQYLALYPDDYRLIGRLGTNLWHQLNDFKRMDATLRRAIKPQAENVEARRYALGIALLGQERYDEALAEFQRSRVGGFTGFGVMYARAYDARGQHTQSDTIYMSGTNGRGGWKHDAAVVTWLDRGQPQKAADAANAWLKDATAAGDVLEALRAHAAIASVAVATHGTEASRLIRELLEAVDAEAAAADAIYLPTSTELRLYAGLLSAQLEDADGVAQALRATQASNVPRDYPTVGQLQQVVLAEQERLAGKPKAAVLRLRPLIQRDTALVAAHWALMRAEQASGSGSAAQVQMAWLATHRGRVFAEATTTEVLRFFNTAVSRKALQATPQLKAQVKPNAAKPQ